MEERKNKNVYLIIIIVLLLIIILGLVYMLFLKQDSKTNDSNKKDNNPTEVKDGDQHNQPNNEQNEELNVDDIAATLISKFNYGKYRFSVQLFANNSNDFYDYNSLPKRYKNGVALLNSNIEAYKQNNYGYRWKKTEVDSKYRELFGYDKGIELNYDGTIDVYKTVSIKASLDSDDNYYYGIDTEVSPFNYSTGGGLLIQEDFFKILNSTLKDDTLEVTFKYATIEGVIQNIDKYNVNLYSEINLTSNDENETLIEKIDCSKSEYNICKISNSEYTDEKKKEDVEKVVTKYSDKLDTYKYTFKYDKEHKNYYFYSIEKL